MKINYEMVYEVRKAQVPTDSLSNLRISYSNDAVRRADAEHEKYLILLKKQLGHSAFEVTGIACLADGIRGHVYVGDAAPGFGRRHCCFCGCDDGPD